MPSDAAAAPASHNRVRLPDAAEALAALFVALLCSGGLLWAKATVPGFLLTAVLVAGVASVAARRFPVPEAKLALLFAAFIGWSVVTAFWAITPDESLDRAAKQLLIPIGLSLPLFSRPVAMWLQRRRSWLLAAFPAGLAVGWVLLAIEHGFDFPIYRLTRGLSLEAWHDPSIYDASAYNRGVIAFAVLAWPAAAVLWVAGAFGRRAAMALIALAGAAALISSSAAAVAVTAIAVSVFGMAWVSRRLVRVLVVGGLVLMAATASMVLPAIYAAVGAQDNIPHSFYHRLELFDFTADRIDERPLLGWGFANTRHLPMYEEDLPGYRILDRPSTHPHNAFLQARVETGVPGLMLMTAIMLVALARTARLPRPIQPFALACSTAVLGVASVSFSAWSAPWLIVIIMAVFAFFALSRLPLSQDPGGAAAC